MDLLDPLRREVLEEVVLLLGVPILTNFGGGNVV